MGLLTYHGDGKSLFKIYIVNVLLSVITLGVYYPWAKAKLLAYHYSETELENSRFAFLGTGKEIFKGFVKALLIFAVWYGGLFYFTLQLQTGEDVAFFYYNDISLGVTDFVNISLSNCRKFEVSTVSYNMEGNSYEIYRECTIHV